MTVYTNTIIENTEVVTLKKSDGYYQIRQDVLSEVNAYPITVNDISNVSFAEMKLYEYMFKQGFELIASDEECTTAIVNDIEYKAICLEGYLLDSKHSAERLFSIAHELGHYLDSKFNHENEIEFSNFYENNMIACEVVAWKYALDILKAIGLETSNILKPFKALAVNCLGSYTDDIKKAKYLIDHMEEITKVYEASALV